MGVNKGIIDKDDVSDFGVIKCIIANREKRRCQDLNRHYPKINICLERC
jgi:hypothetical protein